ncbi:hypothetical protein K469DRAFT_351513 [Zopfia rhizophila CBS 207.26]|uniref:B30.2/SPRY domain-containing protein n=1 Tax=Zopfia rhizophila CBS 207.26 TaxID=1314779 RepID=A0A6A6DHQ9_9PEZI|nr:hypothetical protein K469DRAFT_351513 [Zopfia rhizophila CBS 207.26]
MGEDMYVRWVLLCSRYVLISRRAVAIGICTQSVNPNALPGWRGCGSYGYHSDDGRIFHMTGTGERTGHTYGQGDIVGCLVHMETRANRTIKFTHNGEEIGPSIRLEVDMRGQLYPCVGLIASADTVGTVVRANFRAEWPLDGEVRNRRTATPVPRLEAFDEREDTIEEQNVNDNDERANSDRGPFPGFNP